MCWYNYQRDKNHIIKRFIFFISMSLIYKYFILVTNMLHAKTA